MALADPLLAPRAKQDLAQVNAVMRLLLRMWIHRLVSGQIDVEKIHVILQISRHPPWQWGEFGNYAVVFRFLSDSELRTHRVAKPTVLIARIIPLEYLDTLVKELLAEAQSAK
jgi:hypothetical protein